MSNTLEQKHLDSEDFFVAEDYVELHNSALGTSAVAEGMPNHHERILK